VRVEAGSGWLGVAREEQRLIGRERKRAEKEREQKREMFWKMVYRKFFRKPFFVFF
jgi:hypothetical protein